MKLTWNLVFKILISLFWIVCMIGFIDEAIHNRKTFAELLIRWDIVAIFFIFLFGCISIVLNTIWTKKNFIVGYFIIMFFLYLLFCLSIY